MQKGTVQKSDKWKNQFECPVWAWILLEKSVCICSLPTYINVTFTSWIISAINTFLTVCPLHFWRNSFWFILVQHAIHPQQGNNKFLMLLFLEMFSIQRRKTCSALLKGGICFIIADPAPLCSCRKIYKCKVFHPVSHSHCSQCQ